MSMGRVDEKPTGTAEPARSGRPGRKPIPTGVARLRSLSLSLVVAASVAMAATNAGAQPRADSVRAFFPARPAGAKLHVLTGVLVEFGIGNGAGGLALRRGTTTWTLYTGANLRLNGRPLACDHPPRRDAPKSIFCPAWPASVVLGSTSVAATYWLQPRPGSPGLVKVTDELRSLAHRS